MKMELAIEGMTCGHCVKAVRGALEKMPGVEVEDVRMGAATLVVDPTRASPDDIVEAVADEGYTASHVA